MNTIPTTGPASPTAPASSPDSDAAAVRSMSAVPSTMRIPLAARAFGGRLFPAMDVDDRDAARIMAAIGDDGATWLRDRGSMFGVLARTHRLRALARAFVARHPGGHVVNLGCGLANYFQWLNDGQMRMTDADLPETMAVRRRLLPSADPRHELREFDLGDPHWWDALGLPARPDGPPVFLFSEGVLMYLQPRTVQALLRTFGERAPAGSTFAFDAMCWLATGTARRHTSVRHTGAQFQWGPRRPAELTAPSPRLRLASADSVMDGHGWPYSVVGPVFRFVTGVPLYGLYELRT